MYRKNHQLQRKAEGRRSQLLRFGLLIGRYLDPRAVKTIIQVRRMAIVLFVLAFSAHATIVQTEYAKISESNVDFGSGLHSSGIPAGNGVLTVDYSVISGQLVASGRIRGTAYWDSPFSSGNGLIRIEFLDDFGTVLATRDRFFSGTGGSPNNLSNQLTIDESFSSSSLNDVRVSTFEVSGTFLLPRGVRLLRTKREVKLRPKQDSILTAEGDRAKFAGNAYSSGNQFQFDGGEVQFERENGIMRGRVNGILYWDAAFAGCARMIAEFQTEQGFTLSSSTFDQCGPGWQTSGPVENGGLALASFANGSLFRIKLQVGTVTAGIFKGVNTKTYSFTGETGTFEVIPDESSVDSHDTVTFEYSWTVPDPLNWHDLETMDLRIVSETETILWIRFYEPSNTLSVFNEASGRFGRGFPAASSNPPQSRYASLDLAEARVGAMNSPLGSGPLSPTVKLILPITFKPSAGGRTFRIEVAAKDKLGNDDPFKEAGIVTVSN